MFISFEILQSHPLAKGLSAGRARPTADEGALEAIARKIAQETRCEVLSLARVSPSNHRERGEHYELTIRGYLTRFTPTSEGTIRVRVRRATDLKAPREVA